MSAIEIPASLRGWLDAQPAVGFEANQALVTPDSAPSHLWFLHAGLVRVYTLSARGEEFNHDFLGEGDWVLSRLTVQDGRVCCSSRAIGVIALQPTTAVRVELATLEQWRATDPAVAGYLTCVLLEWAGVRYGREADLAQRSAEERYRDLIAKKPGLLSQVPLQTIAGWLAITPVALSRIRRRLRQP